MDKIIQDIMIRVKEDFKIINSRYNYKLISDIEYKDVTLTIVNNYINLRIDSIRDNYYEYVYEGSSINLDRNEYIAVKKVARDVIDNIYFNEGLIKELYNSKYMFNVYDYYIDNNSIIIKYSKEEISK